MKSGETAFELYRNGELLRAEEEARTALAGGDDAGLRHLLGVLLCRRGSIAEGAEQLAHALALAPGHAAIRVSYVRALIDLGKAEDALRHARRPMAGPAAADLWRLRAEAAEAAGEPADRLEALHNVELETTTAELERRPGDAQLRLHRARLLAALARDEEAADIYRDLLRTDPANSEVVLELGLLFERHNRLDEARALIESALAAGAQASGLALLQAFLAWRDGEPEETLRLLAKATTARDPVRAKELEAKAHDALGHTEAAFAAAEAKNRSVRDYEHWRRRGSRYRNQLRELSGLITPEWAAGWSPATPGASRPPVFLVGFPRSGTTLLDTFLMGHPEIAVLEEIPALGLVAERVGSPDNISGIGESGAEELRRFYFDRVDRFLPEKFDGMIVDKLPLNMLNVLLIHRLFPTARLIFAQRHPCDCVLSAFFQSFAMNPAMACFLDLRDAADLYDAAMGVWTRSEAALPLNAHRIAYENFVAHPESELRKVTDFLELKWNDRLLDHRRTAGQRGAIGTPSYDQVVSEISTCSVGRWKRYEKQLEPVLPVLLPWAERLGYRG